MDNNKKESGGTAPPRTNRQRATAPPPTRPPTPTHDPRRRQDEKQESGIEGTSVPEPAFGNATQECVACLDEFKANIMIKCPCGKHWYCIEDLKRLVEASLEDDSSFPPSCGGFEFRINDNTKALGKELVLRFKDKKEEMYTLNRIYCHSPICGAWSSIH